MQSINNVRVNIQSLQFNKKLIKNIYISLLGITDWDSRSEIISR
jgi:hypothetical protein